MILPRIVLRPRWASSYVAHRVELAGVRPVEPLDDLRRGQLVVLGDRERRLGGGVGVDRCGALRRRDLPVARRAVRRAVGVAVALAASLQPRPSPASASRLRPAAAPAPARARASAPGRARGTTSPVNVSSAMRRAPSSLSSACASPRARRTSPRTSRPRGTGSRGRAATSCGAASRSGRATRTSSGTSARCPWRTSRPRCGAKTKRSTARSRGFCCWLTDSLPRACGSAARRVYGDGPPGPRLRARTSRLAHSTQSPKRTYGRLTAHRGDPSADDLVAEQLASCGWTSPSASMTAVMPEIDAWRTGRPIAAALIWLSATCWAEFGDRRYERLLVDHDDRLRALADRVAHERRERGLEADHVADRVPVDVEHLRRVARRRSRSGSAAAR